MLSKIQSSLYRISRNWSYFIVCGIVAVAIVITDARVLKSEIYHPVVVRERWEEPISMAKFSKMVATVENKWKGDYDRYFQRDFSTNSRSATKIAKRLKEIKNTKAINPAVIWAIPQDDFLRLILITPEKQFVTRDIRGANRARLTQRVE